MHDGGGAVKEYVARAKDFREDVIKETGQVVGTSERNFMNIAKGLDIYLLKDGIEHIEPADKNTTHAGRKRLADSADLWDISRAVFLSGKLKGGLFYISQEKNNYAPPARTLLFDLEGGRVNPKGFTDKHDKDFVTEDQYATRQAPAKEEAKEFILETLQEHGGSMETSELLEWADAVGISGGTLKRAKTELKKEGKVSYKNEGYGEGKKYFIGLKPLET